MNPLEPSTLVLSGALAPKKDKDSLNALLNLDKKEQRKPKARAKTEKTQKSSSQSSGPLNPFVKNLVKPAPTAAPSIAQIKKAPEQANRSTQQARWLATALRLKSMIVEELRQNLNALLNLNPSRRDALVSHLCQLAKIPSSGFTHKESSKILREWIAQREGTPHHQALRRYLDEVALVYIGQALLLKNWNDRKLRSWEPSDLGHINWVLSQVLKPHVPLKREGWQLTRPNLYSWYSPSPSSREIFWTELNHSALPQDEGYFITELVRVSFQEDTSHDQNSYDERFFYSIWKNLTILGFDANQPHHEGMISRKKVVFCPTLRDGTLPRSAPDSLEWVGLEHCCFNLLIAELSELWCEPKEPPFWSVGSGLEVKSNEQMSLSWNVHRPSTKSHISEMEACDLAILLEEKTTRLNGKSPESQFVRNQVQTCGTLKKLKSNQTTLGGLQACISSEKLRPNGILLWARQTPLSLTDGPEILKKLFGNCQLVCEFDFSQVTHSLPTQSRLFPEYLYIFRSEIDREKRNRFRPTIINIHGKIRSHVEVETLLENAFHSFSNKKSAPYSRGNWKIHARRSPYPQIEWLEHWPDPATESTIQSIEQLKTHSTPLGQIGVVRSVNSKDQAWTVPDNYYGIWLYTQTQGKKTVLKVVPLKNQKEQLQGKGFLVVLPESKWTVPIANVLESNSVNLWLNHFAEQRNHHWILSEQTVKYLPIPHAVLKQIQKGSTEHSEQLENLLKEVPYHPDRVSEYLQKDSQKNLAREDYATLFIHTSEAIDQLMKSQSELFSLISEKDQVKWGKFIPILPKQDLILFPLHPNIRILGSLPGNIPIHSIQKIDGGYGIHFRTQTGMEATVSCDHPVAFEILWDFLKDLSYPTWNELTHAIRLPRDLELSQQTAREIITSYNSQKNRLRELRNLSQTCLSFC